MSGFRPIRRSPVLRAALALGVVALATGFRADGVVAAERQGAPETLTPRDPPTAVVPDLTAIAPDLGAAERPVGAAVLSPAPVPAAPLGGLMFDAAPPAVPAPLTEPSKAPPKEAPRAPPVAEPRQPESPPSLPPPPPESRETASSPMAEVLAEVGAIPVATPGRKPPPPSAARRRSPMVVEEAGTPVDDFSAFERGCDLPEDAPDRPPVVPPGTRLTARVASFMRVAPHCRARILDVLEAGTVVTVLGGGDNGWYRVRGQGWPAAWVGARLLARLPQR